MPIKKSPELEEDVLDIPESIDLEKEELKNRLDILEKYIKSQEPKKEIQNDFQEELEKPKRILFTINALDDENAQFEGAYIPGKAMVGEFKVIDELKCNESGDKYTTGFEYDELEYTSGLTGEALLNYQNEVRTARKWIERRERINLDCGNKEFWSKRKIKIEALGFIYDTDLSIDNLITYYNIIGGGFASIARSEEEARTNTTLVNNQRLYVSEQEEEAERGFSKKRTYIQANSALEDIMDNWSTEDALYLMYYLPIKKQLGYTTSTPKSQIINQLSDFVDGLDTKTEKTKRPKQFIEAAKMFEVQTTKDTLRTTALFNVALYYGFIHFHSKEKNYKNRSTGFEYGNSLDNAIKALQNPKNIEELSWLKNKVKEKWNN